MRDYLDDFLAADDSEIVSERKLSVGIVVGEHAKTSAELEEIEHEILSQNWDVEFREPDCLAVADYWKAKTLGLLSPEDEALMIADILTRIA